MNNIILLFNYIATDMMEPVGYLPWGLALGGCFLAAVCIRQRRCGKFSLKDTLKQNVLYFLTIVYGATLLKLAFFSREPGSRTGISLHLFETWGSTIQEHAFFIENILMFIPFGIFAPLLSARLQDFFKCTAAAFLCSFTLEFLQLITSRGFCQLDDVVTNTIGGMIGYTVYYIWRAAISLRSV